MRRVVLILSIGLIGAAVAYCALYLRGTSRERNMMESSSPELAWLREEFRLSDSEFRRIAELHDGYLPQCDAMCRKIAQKNSEMKALVGQTNSDPAALHRKLAEAAQLRLECQSNMLSHFIAVSQQMPAEQGRRYLQWIQEKTLLHGSQMMESH
jgi:hypothetical protein